MVAEALTRAHSCFNHPTGGYGDEEKWRSGHHTVDHQRAMRHEEALRRWWSVAWKDVLELKPGSSNKSISLGQLREVYLANGKKGCWNLVSV